MPAHMDSKEYFQAYKSYFWQWEEKNEIIAIPGGDTIAYVRYIQDVVDALSSQGLPPFGALLLVIAATNYSTGDPLGQIQRIIENDSSPYFGDMPYRETQQEAMELLRVLAALPAKYTTSSNR